MYINHCMTNVSKIKWLRKYNVGLDQARLSLGSEEGETELAYRQGFESDLLFCEKLIDQILLFNQSKLNQAENRRKTKDVILHISKMHY